MTTTAEQVRALLDISGITPTDAEVEKLTAVYPDIRARVERLWALNLGDAQPSLVFRAAEVAGPADPKGA